MVDTPPAFVDMVDIPPELVDTPSELVDMVDSDI